MRRRVIDKRECYRLPRIQTERGANGERQLPARLSVQLETVDLEADCPSVIEQETTAEVTDPARCHQCSPTARRVAPPCRVRRGRTRTSCGLLKMLSPPLEYKKASPGSSLAN